MFSDEVFEQTFCNYAMCLFRNAGHTDASSPIYVNHSVNQVMYFDSQKDIALSNLQRATLSLASNISFLFEISDDVFDKTTGRKIAFYSAITRSSLSSRSQDAHNVHTLLRQYWDCAYSVIAFFFESSVILSFADGSGRIILSDWYNIDSDLDSLLGRLDISNVSIHSVENYLSDLIYSLARWYYIYPISPEEAAFGLFQIDYFSSSERNYKNIDRDKIKEIIKSILCLAEKEYDADYVDPDDQEMSSAFDLGAEIDLLGLELEMANDEEFETDLDDEESCNEDDDFEDDDALMDKYIFDDVDPEIFNDPILMVKWLEKKEKEKAPR